MRAVKPENQATESPLETGARPVTVGSLLTSTKVQSRHLDRLAVVYVRQSSLQQVLDHRESRARQYALAGHASGLGWDPDRVLVFDEDQGRSGTTMQYRDGFQRILAEVTMDHVGIVLSLEMSRLARSSKDWHHLLEVCALFGTLLGDQDGIYDPNDSNDRLLLGLKGTMSEVELFTMRNRLDRGRLFKAERCELFGDVPFGYQKLPNGQVVMEMDEQARAVVQLLFNTLDELGTIHGVFRYFLRHGILLGMRQRMGAQRGQLIWRPPSMPVLARTFRHPFYAGCYAYGYRAGNRKDRGKNGRAKQKWRPMSEWKVFKRDTLPAYITWEKYLVNLERIRNNRTSAETPGTARAGCALLSGLLICGRCGSRIQTQYRQAGAPYYLCTRGYRDGDSETCCGLAANGLDDLVARQVLRALEPAALDVSREAARNVGAERERLHKHWQRQLERARFDAARAERQYQAVEPENRLVVRTLESNWEKALVQLRNLEEEYERFCQSLPTELTEEDQRRIESLAKDVPALWSSESTSHTDRKEIVRCLIERVIVQAEKDRELVDVTICWRGGATSQHRIIRPVASYEQQRDFKSLMERLIELRLTGSDTARLAEQLNTEGYHPPKRAGCFNAAIVRRLLIRTGIGDDRQHPGALLVDEWWLSELARHLGISGRKLRLWARWGWVHSRKTQIQRLWIVWADADEQRRLGQLRDRSQQGVKGYPAELTTPKAKPPSHSDAVDEPRAR